MPEGDTIFRTARTLQKALGGATITAFETMFPYLQRVHVDQGVVGRSVRAVEAQGKWCLIYCSGDLILLTHMLMSGSWHLYRTGERWQRSRSTLRILLQTKDFVALGFNIPVAEFHTEQSLQRRTGFAHLGPDVLGGSFDIDEVLRRVAQSAYEEVGEVLLNQHILAGVGNIYKSEICFVSGINPFLQVHQLEITQRKILIQNARRLLLSNVKDGSADSVVTYVGPRRTTNRMDPHARLWVYGRQGKACFRCGEQIQLKRQGVGARVTFWCPCCQPENKNRLPGNRAAS